MLIPDHLILPTFYPLLKVHKDLNPLHGKPIINGIGSHNERINQWLDGQLQPLVYDLPGFLRDTNPLLGVM